MTRRADLDDFDRRILTELQRDSRQTLAELGTRVGLSQTPCWRRVRRLEEAGVIRGYGVRVDPAAVGFGEVIFAFLTMGAHTVELQDEIRRALELVPEIQEAHFLSGDPDFLLKILAVDSQHYVREILPRLYRLPHVRSVRSSFSLGRVKEAEAVPVQ